MMNTAHILYMLALQITSICGHMCVLFGLIQAAREDQPPLCQSVSTGPLKRFCKQLSLHIVNPPVRLSHFHLGNRFSIFYPRHNYISVTLGYVFEEALRRLGENRLRDIFYSLKNTDALKYIVRVQVLQAL